MHILILFALEKKSLQPASSEMNLNIANFDLKWKTKKCV